MNTWHYSAKKKSVELNDIIEKCLKSEPTLNVMRISLLPTGMPTLSPSSIPVGKCYQNLDTLDRSPLSSYKINSV